MNLKKQFTTVTPFSKSVALLLMIALPFIGFYLGKGAYQSLSLPGDQVQPFGASAVREDNISITFTEPMAIPKDNKTSDMKPRAGYQFVSTDIILNNQGSKTSSMFSTLERRIVLTDSDGLSYPAVMFGHADKNFVDEMLKPGQSTKAFAIFEIPDRNQAKTIIFANQTVTFE